MGRRPEEWRVSSAVTDQNGNSPVAERICVLERHGQRGQYSGTVRREEWKMADRVRVRTVQRLAKCAGSTLAQQPGCLAPGTYPLEELLRELFRSETDR